MERLYHTAEQRKLVLEWLRSERTLAAMASKYAISSTAVGLMRRNVDAEYSPIMRARVWNAIREWKRAKGGQDDPVECDLPGMPPTRRSILLEMIQKELDTAGEDRLERFYKAIVTA